MSARPNNHTGPLAACLASAAFACGKWEEIDRILPKLDEIRELVMQYDPSALVEFTGGYLAALWVALAREDRPQIDALTAIIRRDGAALEPALTFYLDCLVSDNVSPILENWTTEQVVNDELMIGLLYLMNEHGQTVPDPRLLGALGKLVDEFALYRHVVRIATAIAAADDAQLATAIGDADSGQNNVHAARMRIILAQRTRDRAQLEGARPVLERLGDRRHLGKLEDVEVVN